MKVILRVPLFVLLSSSLLFLSTGCEGDPNTDDVGSFFDGFDLSGPVRQESFAQRAAPLTEEQEELVIGPEGALVAESDGQIVEITLSGAAGSVSWDVAFDGQGELVTTSSLGATYRRTDVGDNVVSATDSSGRSVAKVIQQPGGAGDPGDADDLEIGPTDPIELEQDGDKTNIELTGAVGNVVWSVSDTNRGDIVPDTTSSTGATYRRDSAGDNVVSAVDETGRQVNIVIRQP